MYTVHTHTHTHTHTTFARCENSSISCLAKKLLLFILGAMLHVGAISQPTMTVTCEERECGGLCYTFSTNMEGPHAIIGAENQNTLNLMVNRYDARQNTLEWPPSINPANSWFFPSTINPNCPVPENPTNLNSGDSTIAQSGINGGEGTIWSLERYLYEKLVENPDLLLGNTLMQSFVNASQNTAMGQLYEMGKAIQSLFEIPASTQSVLHANAADIQAQLDQITAIDSLLSSNPPNEVTLLEQRQQHSDTISMLHSENAAIYTSLHNSKMAEADVLLAENSAISTGADYDTNERQFFDVYLRTIAKDKTIATTTQLQTLKDIANQCPEEGGRAVYWAIGLYGNLTDTLLTIQECDLGFRAGKPNSEKANQSGNYFSVSPNPSPDDCRISYLLSDGQTAKLFIYDLAGVKISEHRLTSDAQSMTLSDFSPGVYLLHLIVQGKTVQVEKFVKL